MGPLVKSVVRRVRTLVDQAGAGQSDRQLLLSFADAGDEAAFAVLVRRHGPLVHGVCQRILGNVQDAEDAFQATFLVLARKAGKVAWQESIKNWLYGVACRVAMKARRQALRRRHTEQAARQQAVGPPPAWQELRSVLDEELQRLPADYRAPLVLCYLEGRTRDEAAEELCCSAGSVKGRLERGRELLRARLAQRGLTLPAALCLGLLGESAATAIAAPLAEATARAACEFTAGQMIGGLAPGVVPLAQGVLQAMFIAKLKTSSFVFLLCSVLGAGGWSAHQASADTQERQVQREPERERPVQREPERERPVQREPEREKPVQREPEREKPVQREPERERPAQRDQQREKPVQRDQERPVQREGDRRDDGPHGQIKTIDAKVGTITVERSRDGGPALLSFNLASKDIPVKTSTGQEASVSDLRPGHYVYLQLKGEDVAGIRVNAPMLTGTLGGVDAARRTIVVTAGGGRERAVVQTVAVAPNARLLAAGREAKLADLRDGEYVQVTLALDGQTALAVETGRPLQRDQPRRDGEAAKEPRRDPPRADEARRDQARRDARPFGVVLDVDPARNAVKLLLGREEQTIQEFETRASTRVKIRFDERIVQEVSLAELGKHLNVAAVLGDDGKIVALEVNAPVVRGILKGVDAAGKVTIDILGQSRVLDVGKDVQVRVRGQEARLNDLENGAPLTVGLSLDRQRIIGIVAGERR